MNNKPETVSYHEAFQILFKNNKLKNGSILAGAAISTILNSGLPLGRELLDFGLNSTIKSRELTRPRGALKRTTNFKVLTPENVFGIMLDCFDNSFLKLFQLLQYSNSNKLHKALAYLINQDYCSLYTTNFDLLIDNHCVHKDKVIHLHGSIKDISSICVTLRSISKGVESNLASKFINGSIKKCLLVMGYSGNDKDIIDLINKSSFEEIYWMMHNTGNSWEIKNISNIRKKVFIFEGDLNIFTSDIESQINIFFENDENFSGKQIRVKQQETVNSFHFHDFNQIMVLVKIYKAIGYYDHVIQLCQKRALKTKITSERQHLWNYVSDAHRMIGSSFSVAMRYANKAIDLSTKHNASILERILSLNIKGLILLEKKRSDPIKALNQFKEIRIILESDRKNEIFGDLAQKEIFIAKIDNNIGLCHLELKRYPTAIRYFEKSIQVKEKYGELLSEVITLCNHCIANLKCQGFEDSQISARLNYLFAKFEYDLLAQKAYYLRRTGIQMCENGNRSLGIKRLKESSSIYGRLGRTDFDDELIKMYIENSRR